MLLSVITVAFRNVDGVMKTWRSLAHLANDPSLSFEWIVVDGGSNDGTAEFLEKRNGQYQLRYVSEPDVSEFRRQLSSGCVAVRPPAAR